MKPRILLSAYQCAPGQGSVSQIGWEWYSRMASRCPVTLVTHIRNRPALEAAGAPLHGGEVIYIDTEWFAGPLYSVSKRLFPRSEHSVFLFSSLDFFVFDRQALRVLMPRRQEFDVVHVVTPVSPSAHSRLAQLGLPVVRGPLNGGLTTPPNFPEFMSADSAWLYSVRDLSKPLRRLLGATDPAVAFSANRSTDQALQGSTQSPAFRMSEIAVEPALYQPAEWPAPPTKTNPVRVLFVGRLVPFKALPLLLRAMRQVQAVQPVELTVIGDGPKRRAWEQAADGLSVRFLGACPPNRINEELAQAHAFCLPSVRESGGAVLLEAMSAARPVIAVNYGGPAELVNERVGTLVPADSPSAVVNGIANALLDVARNPHRWQEKGLAGRRLALDTHSWDCRIQTGFDTYSKLLGNRPVKVAA